MHWGTTRLISHPKMNGPLNMAIDEALSRTVVDGPPVLRFYGFAPPALSVGRFQSSQDSFLMDKLARDGIDFVRRPTGGQAVLHDDELTYSFALARTHIDPFRKRRIYLFISEILISALRFLGIASYWNPVREGEKANPDCFGTTGEYEIVSSSGKKLIGSAQSITRLSCLQHGSIPLRSSKKKLIGYLKEPRKADSRQSSSLEAELGRSVTLSEAKDAFRRSFSEQLALVSSTLSLQEERLAFELLKEKYMEEKWNFRL